MQDINNKLHDILEKVTDFFEDFVDEMAEIKTNWVTTISHVANISNKLDAISVKLDTIINKMN